MNVMPTTGKRLRLKADRITLAHGGGGKAMRDLIEDVFVAAFGVTEVQASEDQARLSSTLLDNPGAQIAFTTDSFVVDRGVDVGLPFEGAAPDLGAYELGVTEEFLKDIPRPRK